MATLYYGGHLVIDDRLTGGRLVSFILYQMQLGYCIEVGMLYDRDVCASVCDVCRMCAYVCVVSIYIMICQTTS